MAVAIWLFSLIGEGRWHVTSVSDTLIESSHGGRMGTEIDVPPEIGEIKPYVLIDYWLWYFNSEMSGSFKTKTEKSVSIFLL